MKKAKKITAWPMTSLLLDGKIMLGDVPIASRLKNGVHYYACAYRCYRDNPVGENPLDILRADIATLPDCSRRQCLQGYLSASNEMSDRGQDVKGKQGKLAGQATNI